MLDAMKRCHCKTSDRLHASSAYGPAPRGRRRATLVFSFVAFSLVELVIVVVIIGIIASIAIPRISSSAAGSNEAALKADLMTLRNTIDRYAAEHNGVFPGAATDGIGGAANSAPALVNQLTKFSNAQGQVSLTQDPGYRFGPYLRRLPPLPVGDNRDSSDVAIDTSNSPPVVTTGAEGWVYNPLKGEIIANSDHANRDNTRAYDEY